MPAVLVSLETGVRRRELFQLQWRRHVDLQAGNLQITNDIPKDSETRDIPLSKTAVRVLRKWELEQGNLKSGLVLCHPDGSSIHSLRKAFEAVLHEAGIEKVTQKGIATWHSLRHSFASNAVRRIDLATGPRRHRDDCRLPTCR